MTTTFDTDPAARLAAGFAAHLSGWAQLSGADEATCRIAARAADAVSRATSDGHVCTALATLASDLGVDSATLRPRLLASGVVGTPEQPAAMPLILDADGRLYLHRYFDYERRLAARLVRATRLPPLLPATSIATLRDRLDTLFAANRSSLGDRVDWQQLAAAMALRGRLTVISGGPGTGKTTTVVNLLACLLAENPDCRIALAAPTGKAAARMTEAIRQRAVHLPEAVRDRMPTESSTVHRLLGVTPAAGGFVHDADRPLAIDVLVVDEASMLDLALATRLLEAVPDAARIVLLGDKDQLSAVESGAVFADLSADPGLSDDGRHALAELCGLAPDRVVPPAAVQPSPLQDAVVWFEQNFRFAADSGIGRLAADINAARAQAAVDWLGRGTDDSVRWINDDEPTRSREKLGSASTARTSSGDRAAMTALIDGYAPYLAAVRRDPADAAAITDAFGRFRALCAVREGPRGVAALNERMTREARETLASLNTSSAGDGRSPWFVGRPVMVLRNDPVQKLYNGDIGIALPDADGNLAVAFPDTAGGFRRVPLLRLPEHQTAFATTVHKSQGSEFDAVLVLLPRQRTAVVTRELLYTAVTRARQRVTLVGSAAVIVAAIDAPTRRLSGLIARLRDAAREIGTSNAR